MKKLFFAAMAATILFTSCEKGSEVQPEPLGESAMLNISIQSPAMNRAVVSDPKNEYVDVIKNLSVFITDKDDNVKWTTYAESVEKIENIVVNTNAKHVYVVANAGNLTNLQTPISTKTNLEDLIADLNDDSNGMQKENTCWATGQTTKELEFEQIAGTTDYKADVEMTLIFIAARITLKIKNNMNPNYDHTKEDGSLVLQSVAVLNARGQSKLFGNSLIPNEYKKNKKFYTGIEYSVDNKEFSNHPKTDEYTVAEKILFDNIPANFEESTFYYYVFENDAIEFDTFPTIVTIIGTFNGKKVYYPVHLTKNENWVQGKSSEDFIKRGNSYDITIDLTVDPTKEGDNPGGNSDPTEKLVNSLVNVSVDLKPWFAIPLEKKF